MLAVSAVTKRFGGIQALDGLSVECLAGQVTALIGPNGAGKTTLLDVICGVERADSGHIAYQGVDLIGLDPWQVASLGIKRTFQTRRPPAGLLVREALAMGVRARGWDGLWSAVFRAAPDRAIVAGGERAPLDVLGIFGIAELADRRIGELSFGEQKLVGLACARAGETSLLLLDEPTSGVQSDMKRRLSGLLRTFTREDGLGVIMIEHDLQFVADCADRVIVVCGGRNIIEGPPDKVLKNGMYLRSYVP